MTFLIKRKMNFVVSCIVKRNVQSFLEMQIIYVTTRGLATQSKTYYDALEILPNASQNEVKSSYYKLTLRYHPDRNKTELAKRKFQEISDAYEILGNIEKRKVYDKTLFPHRIRSIDQQSHDKKSQTEDDIYKYSMNLRRTKVYDIDEWTRRHYEDRFNSIKKQRKEYEFGKRSARDLHTVEKMPTGVKLIILSLVTLLICSVMYESYDKPLPKATEQTLNQQK